MTPSNTDAPKNSRAKKKKIESALNSLFSAPTAAPSAVDEFEVLDLAALEAEFAAAEAAAKSSGEVAGLPPATPPAPVVPGLPASAVAAKSPAPAASAPVAATPTPVATPAPAAPAPVASTPAPAAAVPTAKVLQLVAFSLAEEHFAVDITHVESIIKLQTITEVPHAHPYVQGVTNLRGTVLPVIDLRKRLGMAEADQGREARIVVMLVGEEKIGVLVDGVEEVASVSTAQIEPLPSMAANVEASFINGIAKVDGRLVTILDVQKVLRP